MARSSAPTDVSGSRASIERGQRAPVADQLGERDVRFPESVDDQPRSGDPGRDGQR